VLATAVSLLPADVGAALKLYERAGGQDYIVPVLLVSSTCSELLLKASLPALSTLAPA
jgi:hypothetical protein